MPEAEAMVTMCPLPCASMPGRTARAVRRAARGVPAPGLRLAPTPQAQPPPPRRDAQRQQVADAAGGAGDQHPAIPEVGHVASLPVSIMAQAEAAAVPWRLTFFLR